MNIVMIKETGTNIIQVRPFCLISFTEAPKLSRFHDDVYESLIAILGTEKLVQVNRYSPYFYGLGKHLLCPAILV
jgi:hypothetical protein